MNITGWDRLLKSWQGGYYSCLFILACLLIALFTTIRFFKNERLYHLLYLYILSGISLFLLCDIFSMVILELTGRPYSVFNELTNLFFALIEYVFFWTFFLLVLKAKFIKKLLFCFFVLFIIAVVS